MCVTKNSWFVDMGMKKRTRTVLEQYNATGQMYMWRILFLHSSCIVISNSWHHKFFFTSTYQHKAVRNNRTMYRIDRKLGQGAFGIVYHLQLSNGSEFALKVAEIGRLKDGVIDSSTEARLMLKLSHAHLVQCCASFSQSRFIYLVMELCPHGTLKNFLSTRRRLVKETLVLAWLGQIADALRYLHACRVIHRDLKTDNIFLDDRKNVKVGDLGIARELDYTAQKAGTFIGTFCYMSPEILQSSTYSFETDIWSLGCCIHEVMTLRQTFAAHSMMEVMDNIMEARVPPMSDAYSRKLQDLVLHMLDKEPERRPDGLEILLDVSKIQGFPFRPGPFMTLENIEVNHGMLVKAVQAFELKSLRNQDIISSHRDKSTFQHSEDIIDKMVKDRDKATFKHSENISDKMIEDRDGGSTALSEAQHLKIKKQIQPLSQYVHANQNVPLDSDRKMASKCGKMKQEEQNHVSRIKKTSEQDHKLQHDVQVQQYSVFKELSSSSHLSLSSKNIEDLSTSSSLSSVNDRTAASTEEAPQTHSDTGETAVTFSEYMDCLARESQQWLQMKFGLLEKRNQEDQVTDDDSDNSVTLYTRAQIVKYNNRKSDKVKTGHVT